MNNTRWTLALTRHDDDHEATYRMALVALDALSVLEAAVALLRMALEADVAQERSEGQRAA